MVWWYFGIVTVGEASVVDKRCSDGGEYFSRVVYRKELIEIDTIVEDVEDDFIDAV